MRYAVSYKPIPGTRVAVNADGLLVIGEGPGMDVFFGDQRSADAFKRLTERVGLRLNGRIDYPAGYSDLEVVQV